MATKMSVGDIAKLKSDGPLMTVVKDRVEAGGSKFAELAWFDGSTLHREVFPKDALEVLPRDEKPE